MASTDTRTANSFSNAYGYDTQMLRNYVHASAMYWPGFDSTSRYQQASLAAATSASVSSSTGPHNGVVSSMNGATTTDGSIAALPDSGGAMSQSSVGGGPFGGYANQATGMFAAHSTTGCSASSSTALSTPHKKKAQPVPDGLKDGAYWERRHRNNDSARRSREVRRQKEEQIAVRVVYLEQENLQLRTECSMLRAEIEKTRIMIYNQTSAAAAAAQAAAVNGHSLKFD